MMNIMRLFYWSLKGVAKKKESFFGAIRGIWSVMRNHYGNVRVDFAQPFSMKVNYMKICFS
jgi:glycerol-3-phosphate O-acyltransferase